MLAYLLRAANIVHFALETHTKLLKYQRLIFNLSLEFPMRFIPLFALCAALLPLSALAQTAPVSTYVNDNILPPQRLSLIHI